MEMSMRRNALQYKKLGQRCKTYGRRWARDRKNNCADRTFQPLSTPLRILWRAKRDGCSRHGLYTFPAPSPVLQSPAILSAAYVSFYKTAHFFVLRFSGINV